MDKSWRSRRYDEGRGFVSTRIQSIVWGKIFKQQRLYGSAMACEYKPGKFRVVNIYDIIPETT